MSNKHLGPLVPPAKEEASAASEDAHVGVRIPYFPVYSDVRHLLRVWPGRMRKQVTGCNLPFWNSAALPRSRWTGPDTWIPKRLADADFELAKAVWNQSKGAVNPRVHYGSLAC